MSAEVDRTMVRRDLGNSSARKCLAASKRLQAQRKGLSCFRLTRSFAMGVKQQAAARSPSNKRAVPPAATLWRGCSCHVVSCAGECHNGLNQLRANRRANESGRHENDWRHGCGEALLP
jgi:hypothetical protein